jgi:hypothetical protein
VEIDHDLPPYYLAFLGCGCDIDHTCEDFLDVRQKSGAASALGI